MGLTITLIEDSWRYNGFECEADFTIGFDSSHLAAGEVYTARAFGMGYVSSIIPDGVPSGYGVKADYTNKKILAYYADYDAVADGALIAVPDGTDLSAVSFRARVRGTP